MQRELSKVKKLASPCCPGHDKFPDHSYGNRRSKHARAKGKQMEHQAARSIAKRSVRSEVSALEAADA